MGFRINLVGLISPSVTSPAPIPFCGCLVFCLGQNRKYFFQIFSGYVSIHNIFFQIDFDTLKKDFKSKETYGALSGAMHLAEIGGSVNIRPTGNRATGSRSFTSKFIGNFSSVNEESVEKAADSTPATRAKQLIEKIVSEF